MERRMRAGLFPPRASVRRCDGCAGTMALTPAQITGLVSPVPTRRLFGGSSRSRSSRHARTRLGPEEFNFGRLFHQAVQGAATDPAHTVLVMASNGHTGTSLAGGTKLSDSATPDSQGC